MSSSPLADQVVAIVIRALTDRFPGVLLSATTDGPERIRVIYREIHNESPRVLGLIRDLEPEYTPEQLADEIVEREIGEPLGSLDGELHEVDGVFWHHGNHPEWRYYY